MRVQTVFDSLAKNTQQQVFAYCLVLVRIALGAICLSMVSEFLKVNNLFGVWLPLVIAALLFGGGALLLGLLVRPAALVLSLFTLYFSYLTWADLLVEQQALHVLFLTGLLALLGLFVAGGSGHALGLDGVVLRNIRRPGRWSKFLFG